MANSLFIACSIDGYIAKEDGGIDWLINIPNEKNTDYGFGVFMNRMVSRPGIKLTLQERKDERSVEIQ